MSVMVGLPDGGTEQRKSVAQSISRYIVNEVVHHDQAVHDRKQGRGNGIGIRVRRDVPRNAPASGQHGDLVEGVTVAGAGVFV
jgi:hypothetical protein